MSRFADPSFRVHRIGSSVSNSSFLIQCFGFIVSSSAYWVLGSGPRVQCLGFRVSDIGVGVSDFLVLRFGVSGFGFPVSGYGRSGFGFRVQRFDFRGLNLSRVSDPTFRFPGFGSSVSAFGFDRPQPVSGFGFRGFGSHFSGFDSRFSFFGFRVSDFGSRVSDLESRVSGLEFRVSGLTARSPDGSSWNESSSRGGPVRASRGGWPEFG